MHDAQLDYYSKRLATCSSDRLVRIFAVTGAEGQEQYVKEAELSGHEGPVWQVAWAHPKFGSVLATCSYDRKVIIWYENPTSKQWEIVKEHQHDSSVNSVAWGPYEFGLVLACASSDQKLSVLMQKDDGTWDVQTFHGHHIGCNAVSWAPVAAPASLISATGPTGTPVKRFASGGCDHVIRIWRCEGVNTWKTEETLEGHTDWVRDVAWAPGLGSSSATLASCSVDRTVAIWRQDDKTQAWSRKLLPQFPDVVWRVSWSLTGHILAVSCGDNRVTMWREGADGEWSCISTANENGVEPAAAGGADSAVAAH